MFNMLTRATNDIGVVKRSHLLAFFVALFVIGVTGYGYFSHVKRIIKEEKQNELAVIADLKAGQITQWRKERLGDAATMHANAMLAARLDDYLNGSTPRTVPAEFKIWMESLCKSHEYRSAALYKPDGTLLLFTVNDAQLDIASPRLVRESVQKGKPNFSDFHRDEDSGVIHLNLTVPIGITKGNSFRTIAVMILDIHPHVFLYPLIQSWPTASMSAETMLVERSGAEILFLNDVRHRAGTALTMRAPLTDNNMPGVRAVLGQEGVFEGKDYRGVAVLAATRTIPGSPWAIVAKVDLAEIYDPIKSRAWWVIFICALLTLVTALGVYNWWFRKWELRKQQLLEESKNTLEATVEERTEELQLERNKLRGILDAIPIPVFFKDAEGRYLGCNKAYEEFRGIAKEDLGGKNVFDIAAPENAATLHAMDNKLLAAVGNLQYETSLLLGDGSRKEVIYHKARFNGVTGEPAGLIGVIQDITSQKAAERIISTHNKALEQLVLDRTKSLEDINEELLVINVELDLRRREAEKVQEIAHLGSWDLDIPSGRLIWSDEVYRIFGLQPREFPATYEAFLEAVHPEDRDMVNSAYTGSVRAGKEGYEIEHRIIRKDSGEVRYVNEKCEHFRDATGTINRSVGMVHDITSHKQAAAELKALATLLERKNVALEEANDELTSANSELELRRHEAESTHKKLQQLSSAVENSPTTIVITDRRGRIEYVNPKFTEITGYLPEEAIGQNPRILNAGLLPKEFYHNLWRTILGGLEWRGDFCNRKKNGDIYWEDGSISPIKDEQGNITHFVAIKEDVTAQKRIGEELLAAKDAADAANRSKSEFLANMSHEIRTPLNAIIGFSSLTLKSSLPPRQHDYIQKIHAAGELLLNVIGDILDFSKIEAGQLEMEHIPFRLSDTLVNVSSMLQQKAQEKGLKLLIGAPPAAATCLIGDPHRLGQVFGNLLSNAVKFTDHGEVVLETTVLTHKNDQLQLEFIVRDTGIGIPAARINELFQPFTQADGSTTRRFGGTGLGLSISKQLVALMGGEIWCESRQGSGSAFRFTAWFGIGQASDIESSLTGDTVNLEQNEASFNFADSRILLVEDNDTNRHLALELLKETGALVDVAGNGKEAVMMITSGSIRYDLVLMDIQMPVMDGYEATRLIRADQRFNALPIIAMTAHAMQEEQRKILEAGIDAHITKPIDARTMLRVMRFFLREQQSSALLHERHEESGGALPEIPVIAGLDIPAALDRLDGDGNLYLWILRSFSENHAHAATAMTEALHRGDTQQALRDAHTVKGIAGTIGAVALEELAQTLETAIVLEQPLTSITVALDRFAAELERLVAELASNLPPDAESSVAMLSGPVDLAVVTPILERLLGYIRGRDGRAERYLDDYQKELAGLPAKELGTIRKCLMNFDFVAAGASLLDLAAGNGITLTTIETEDNRS